MLDLEMQSCTWPRGLLKKSPRRMNHTFLFLMELLGRQGKQDTHTGQVSSGVSRMKVRHTHIHGHTHGVFWGMYRTQGAKIPRRSGV